MKLCWPLVVIDLLILLAFSYGGVKYHYDSAGMWLEVARVIAPFLVGFAIVGWALQAYRLPGSGSVFLGRSLGVWSLGMGAGLIFRGLQRGVFPDAQFIWIALAFTGVLMLLGRGGYWLFRGRRQVVAPSSTSA